MSATPNQFSLTISLNVLEHLGINLYSNVPAVLSEIVANAYDADADDVHVNWNREADTIIIQDTGKGMDPDDINKRFLTVGYRRRDEQPGDTDKGRKPMGRKGIGKLSLFSIAGTVEIETTKEGVESAFRMKLEDIRRKIEGAGGEGTYNPEAISTDEIDFEKGTRITLTDLRKRQTAHTTEALIRRLARRFSIIGPSQGFQVFVDDQEIIPSDRDYYNKLQYLWTYGDQGEVKNLSPQAQHFDRSEVAEGFQLSISGWLGTVREVKHLKDEEGENLNRIAIFVRGKMAQEDILGDFAERGVYASYLIGELKVDELDAYNGPGTTKDDDAATSSRQQLVEDDDRYVEIKRFLATELKHIQNEWQKLRAEEGADKALEIPAVKDWMEAL
ncbi:MAG TPA: ATP-binding protein, partial [Puia sp.]|nr:ATP-binding protein [Puia sp.]